MKTNAEVLSELLAIAKSTLLNGSDMEYTTPDGKYHIYIYGDQASHWDGSEPDTFYVIEPNRVINGAHEPMGDTFLTSSRDLSEVLVGCQWCMDCFEADRAKEESREDALPNELIVRMAHEAGYVEAQGLIELQSWEDLQTAIRDAINQYQNSDSIKSSFSIEEVLDKLLFERFPAAPEPPKSIYKELCILFYYEETTYGLEIDFSLHASHEEALQHADSIRKELGEEASNWNFDLFTQIVDVSGFSEPTPQALAAYLLPTTPLIGTNASLDDMIRSAEQTRNNENNHRTLPKDYSIS